MATVAETPSVPARGERSQRSALSRYIVRRVAGAVAALLAASILIFLAVSVLPGSPASVVLGRGATPKAIAILDKRMGLDKPAPTRYVQWLGGFVHGNLGNSAVAIAQGSTRAPIWQLIRGSLVNSAVLAAIAAILMVPLALMLGVIAAVRHGKLSDHAISLGSLITLSLPEFVTGSLLVALFFVGLHLLPPTTIVPPGQSPLDKPDALVMPVLTLLFASLAGGIRMVRSGMLEALRTDYVHSARLNGLPEGRVVRRYALRNALAPAVQVLAQNLQYLIGGIVVVEAVFGYPGIGTQLVNAVSDRDVTVVQSVAMLIAIVYVLINVIADLIVLLLVPKLRDTT